LSIKLVAESDVAAPVVTVNQDESDDDTMTFSVTVDNHGYGPVNIDWGQSPSLPTGTNPGDGRSRTKQEYTVAGTWSITATDPDRPWVPSGTAQASPSSVSRLAPFLTILPCPTDDISYKISVTVDNHGIGPVDIDWGQDPPLPKSSNPGDNVSLTEQEYTRNGMWTITVSDPSRPSMSPWRSVVFIPVIGGDPTKLP
jgi:hypothetical protein